MKSATRYTLVVYLALFVVLGCILAVHASALPRVIQQKTLVAKGAPQTWESTERGRVVYVHVIGREGEIPQRWINACRAGYSSPSTGLHVQVRLRNCHRAGPHPFLVRYFSTSGRQRFTVRLTNSPHG